MTDQQNRLKEAFAEDHRKLTRGFRDAVAALEKGDLPTARTLADELDKVAGPHIEFEESCLYPAVAENRGEGYTAKLYDEHSKMMKALTELQSASEMSENQRISWLASMKEGLDHAISCGTLLSYLVSLPDGKQDELYRRLEQFRSQQPRRWSQLHQYPRN